MISSLSVQRPRAAIPDESTQCHGLPAAPAAFVPRLVRLAEAYGFSEKEADAIGYILLHNVGRRFPPPSKRYAAATSPRTLLASGAPTLAVADGGHVGFAGMRSEGWSVTPPFLPGCGCDGTADYMAQPTTWHSRWHSYFVKQRDFALTLLCVRPSQSRELLDFLDPSRAHMMQEVFSLADLLDLDGFNGNKFVRKVLLPRTLGHCSAQRTVNMHMCLGQTMSKEVLSALIGGQLSPEEVCSAPCHPMRPHRASVPALATQLQHCALRCCSASASASARPTRRC